MAKKYYETVPEKYDTQSPDLDLKLATLPTVAVNIDSTEAEDVLAGVSPTRLANAGKTAQPVGPNLKIWPASKAGNWVQAGMISVGTGNNTWAGGDNKALFDVGGHLPGCTVTLDGKTIIEKGEWKN